MSNPDPRQRYLESRYNAKQLYRMLKRAIRTGTRPAFVHDIYMAWHSRSDSGTLPLWRIIDSVQRGD